MTEVKSFCRAAVNLAKIDARLRGMEVPKAFLDRVSQWESGLFRLVVMGEFKRGKSSFINALLGHENLLPTCAAVATSVVYKICFGKELKYKVFFTKESGKESLFVSREELEKYGTEDGNPNNRENVDFVLVQIPSPILKNGLVIIDTPGLGGVKSVHKRIAYEYVPKADAVILVTRSDQAPIGEPEVQLLSDIKKITNHIYFVQTFSGQVDTAVCDERMKTNVATLTKAGVPCGADRYFVVDSKIKHSADAGRDAKLLQVSGYAAVMKFINTMIENVGKLIVERGVLSCYSMVEAIEREIEARKKIINASSAEDIAKLKEELKAAEAEVIRWKQVVCPAISKEITTRYENFWHDVQKRLTDLDGTSEFAQRLEDDISACGNGEVNDKYCECEDRIAQEYTEKTVEIGDRIASFAADTVNYICEQCRISDVSVDCEIPDLRFDPNHRPIKNKDSGFEKARAGVYGGMAGTSIAGVVGGALGGVAGFFIAGPAGAVVGAKGGAVLLAGSGIGTAWGAYKGLSSHGKAMAEDKKNQAKRYLQQSIAKNYKALQLAIPHLLRALKSRILSGLDDAVARRLNELAERRTLIEKAAKNKVAEITKAKNELMVMENDFKRCVAIMNG